MAAACPATACRPKFADPRAQIKGSAFTPIVQSCEPEQGILYLTDNAGLLTTTDATQGPFLSASNPTATIGATEWASHYSPCDCEYWDMQCFFSQSKRPSTIMIGLVNAGETLSDAFTRLTACPLCACDVQVSTCKAGGTSWIDTPEYSAFTNLINANPDWTHHAMTYEASTAFTDMFETTSFAAMHADQNLEWTVADVGCRFEYEMVDGECVPTEDEDGNPVQISYYLNSGLTAAALDASHSIDDANYNYTTNSESVACHTGVFIDETTGDVLTPPSDGLTQLTGMDGGVGCPLTGATRHLNAFVGITDGNQESVRYLSSLTANGDYYGDVFYKKKAIDADVRAEVLALQDSLGTDVTESGMRLVALRIKNVLNKWINKGVINPVAQDWGIPDVKINGKNGNGEGYYIDFPEFSELNPNDINCRYAAVIRYCFEVNSPQHGLCIQVCQLEPVTQEGI